MDKKSKIRYDIILIIGLLVITVIIALAVRLTQKTGKTVVVSVDGVVKYTFPLDEDIEFKIEGYEGGTNYLVIKDGEAYLTEASCPDLLCVHMGKISSQGQSIICLPNRVVVEIRDDNENDLKEYDTIVG
ncbi:hypothetical protein SAMN02910276_01715 [Butyrivibrio sp. Su6]|uniref:NusG domain II-containing protein n=1 Tax=Butyrivibrio sp. Su6 TaxID=1520810 RepID=UPI00089EAB34|nr:NusG domain II-containing protein [Butyrivibrio sp. Su6]SEG03943.1 hypothetical protein SAMN02910276_01715 [Butyrivibrio sp. Su6]